MSSDNVVLEDRFANPRGILGEHFNNPLDASKSQAPSLSHDWSQWKVPNDFMLSTQSPSQMWAVRFSNDVRSNLVWLPENSLPRDRFDTLLDIEDSSILFVLEGPLYGPSGIAQARFSARSLTSKPWLWKADYSGQLAQQSHLDYDPHDHRRIIIQYPQDNLARILTNLANRNKAVHILLGSRSTGGTGYSCVVPLKPRPASRSFLSFWTLR